MKHCLQANQLLQYLYINETTESEKKITLAIKPSMNFTQELSKVWAKLQSYNPVDRQKVNSAQTESLPFNEENLALTIPRGL